MARKPRACLREAAATAEQQLLADDERPSDSVTPASHALARRGLRAALRSLGSGA